MIKFLFFIGFFTILFVPLTNNYADDVYFEVIKNDVSIENESYYESELENDEEIIQQSDSEKEYSYEVENKEDFEREERLKEETGSSAFLQNEEGINLRGDHLGTEANPFLAGTASELRNVLNTIRTDPGTGIYYVRLTNNIFYNASDVFDIHKNVVIDGQGFHMLYANNASTIASSTGFRIRTSGIEATLRNMNFGSDTLTDASGRVYDNNTYYGIIGSAGTTGIIFTAILENVNYHARTGAQPFLTWNQQSWFIFKGENTFTSRAGTSSQEFMEGYNVIFAEGSKTTIDHQTELHTGFFFAYGTGGSAGSDGRLRITVEENAEVHIISSKQNFTFGADVIFTIAENAKFFYRQTANRPLNFSNTRATTININKDAQATFLSHGRINSGGSVTFNVNEPDFIRFQNTGNTNGLFARNMAFNRLDGILGEVGDYQFYYLNQAQNLQRREIPGRASQTLADNQFSHTALRQVVYQKGIQVTWDNVVDVGIGKSELLTKIDSYEPARRILTKVDYKLSTERLWSGDSITSDSAQAAIDQATLDTSGVVAAEKSTNLSWHNDQLRAGTYYVYVQVAAAVNDDPEMQLFASESLWEEKQITIDRSPIHVEVPLQKLFDIRESGTFYKIEHSQPIISHSNFPIDFSVTYVANYSANPTIALVDHITEANEEDHLLLNIGATDGQKLGPLMIGENKLDAMVLEPFLTDPLELFLKGEFSGSIFKKHEVDFRLTYTLSAKGDED